MVLTFHHRASTGLFGALFLGFLLASSNGTAQGTPDHIPGKVYLIRLSGSTDHQDSLLHRMLPELRGQLARSGAMTEHIRAHLYLMESAQQQQFFVGYFNADRQGKEELMRDHDLLIWLLHGHNVQIMPIESVKSPARFLGAAAPLGQPVPAAQPR